MGVAAPVGLTFALMVDVLAWGIVAALLIIWRNTFGQALLYVANLLNFHVHIPHVWDHTFNLGKPFAEVEHGVSEWLKAEKVGLEIEIAWTWHALGEVWHKTARMLEWAVNETVGAFERLERVKVPRIAKWAAAAALPAALFAKIVAAVVAKIRPELHKGTTVIEQTFPTKVVQIVRRSEAHALPSPWAFPKFRRSWRELEAWRHLTAKRLHRLEALLAASGLALAVANMTGTTFRCWRPGGNIHRSLRHVCGLPKHLLDDLLGILADVWILENVCVLLPYLEQGASAIGTPLVEALTEVGAGICRGSAAPGALKGPSARLPAPILSPALSLV